MGSPHSSINKVHIFVTLKKLTQQVFMASHSVCITGVLRIEQVMLASALEPHAFLRRAEEPRLSVPKGPPKCSINAHVPIEET
jgi:hypothetical protein